MLDEQRLAAGDLDDMFKDEVGMWGCGGGLILLFSRARRACVWKVAFTQEEMRWFSGRGRGGVNDSHQTKEISSAIVVPWR